MRIYHNWWINNVGYNDTYIKSCINDNIFYYAISSQLQHNFKRRLIVWHVIEEYKKENNYIDGYNDMRVIKEVDRKDIGLSREVINKVKEGLGLNVFKYILQNPNQFEDVQVELFYLILKDISWKKIFNSNLFYTLIESSNVFEEYLRLPKAAHEIIKNRLCEVEKINVIKETVPTKIGSVYLKKHSSGLARTGFLKSTASTAITLSYENDNQFNQYSRNTSIRKKKSVLDLD